MTHTPSPPGRGRARDRTGAVTWLLELGGAGLTFTGAGTLAGCDMVSLALRGDQVAGPADGCAEIEALGVVLIAAAARVRRDGVWQVPPGS